VPCFAGDFSTCSCSIGDRQHGLRRSRLRWCWQQQQHVCSAAACCVVSIGLRAQHLQHPCDAFKSSFRGCSRCSQQMLEAALRASAQRAPGSCMPWADACFAKQCFAHAVHARYTRPPQAAQLHQAVSSLLLCTATMQQHRPASL
jgi:hypothetical protein